MSPEVKQIVIKGKVKEKTGRYVVIESGKTKLEVQAGDIVSPPVRELTLNTQVEIKVKKSAIVKAYLPIDEILSTTRNDKGIIAGHVPGFCRCECYCA